jgi:hypothetical protein
VPFTAQPCQSMIQVRLLRVGHRPYAGESGSRRDRGALQVFVVEFVVVVMERGRRQGCTEVERGGGGADGVVGGEEKVSRRLEC